ncbi:BF3164 family lipoprotein [Cyclobacterium marinum]|uniref:BF3164 family lipoprotein n=1 Tax=Cyclobacterium marinum TaxID=104 RepID=UPI0011EF8A7C|nr:BF3164 family lipoprotein [Cyclobacterium marinum]MBI0399267.1 hypothetical protein [Cyclobacterium marinum]
MNRLILVLILLFSISCEQGIENNDYIIIQKEDFTLIPLQSNKYFFEEIINPSNIGLVDDKILISEAWRVPEEHPRIHIVNSTDWTYDKPKGKHGEGPLELIDASLFYKGENPDTFWTYSMNRRKLVEYSMSNLTLLGKSEWKMTEPMMDLWFFTQATDSSFLGISRVSENRILEFDKEGNRIGGYGNWEKVKDRPELNYTQLAVLNGGFFKGNAEEGLFIRVGLFRDRLEIFNNRDKSFIIIDGPDLELPAFEIIGNELYLGPDPHFRYRDAVVTKNYIFALYGGVSHSDFNKTSVMATQIWVFDHMGQPLYNLKLDRSLINFVINEETNEFYGLTTDEDPGIAVYTIPKELL